MPRKPKRPCSYPGCPKLTDGQYCKEHEAAARRQYNRYGRPADSNKKYGRAWKRIRDRYRPPSITLLISPFSRTKPRAAARVQDPQRF